MCVTSKYTTISDGSELSKYPTTNSWTYLNGFFEEEIKIFGFFDIVQKNILKLTPHLMITSPIKRVH